MSFNNGDIVRFSKNGKVDYTVSEVNADSTLNLTGAKSNRKNVDPDTLTLVHSDWITDDVPALPEKLTDAEIQAIAAHVENPNHDGADTPMAEGENPVKAWNDPFTDSQIEELDETYAEHGMPAAQAEKREMLVQSLMADWELELLRNDNPNRPVVLVVESPDEQRSYTVSQHKTYGAACDAYVLHTRDNAFTVAQIFRPGAGPITRYAAV